MRPYILDSLKNNLTTTHAKSYVLASVCSRWYTPELHVVTIGIYAYASSSPWYHGLYPGVKVLGVKYSEAASDSLLCVGICYKSLARQDLLKGPKPSTGLSGCSADAWKLWTVPLYFTCGFMDSFMCLIFSIRLHFVHMLS